MTSVTHPPVSDIPALRGPARATVEDYLRTADLPLELINDEAAWSCIVRLIGCVRELADRLDRKAEVG